MNFADVLTPPRTSNETNDEAENTYEMTDPDQDAPNDDVMTEEESDIGTAGPATI
jgi:hypothetical protein